MSRPDKGDYGEFYHNYIERTEGENARDLVSRYSQKIEKFIESIPEEKSDYFYEEGKWTVKQILQHMLDAERIFVFRLIWIARGDKRPLPGYDENTFAASAKATHRNLLDLKNEFISLRRSTDILISDLTDWELTQRGEVNGNSMTVNALCFIIVGHTLHHLHIFKERYLLV